MPWNRWKRARAFCLGSSAETKRDQKIVTRKAWLSDQQKRRARQLAREKDLTCPDCGGSEPVPNNEARAHPDGGADLLMRCEECESALEMAVVLSPEEAKALGLHSLGESPQAP